MSVNSANVFYMTLRKNIFVFLSIILLLSQYVYATNNNDTNLVKANYDKAFNFYKNKEYLNAVTYFTAVIKEDKTN
jgi:hypothetical protein